MRQTYAMSVNTIEMVNTATHTCTIDSEQENERR